MDEGGREGNKWCDNGLRESALITSKIVYSAAVLPGVRVVVKSALSVFTKLCWQKGPGQQNLPSSIIATKNLMLALLQLYICVWMSWLHPICFPAMPPGGPARKISLSAILLV